MKIPAGAIALFAAVLALIGYGLAVRNRRLTLLRLQYVKGYVFPSELLDVLARTYPHLKSGDCQLIARALRQFFLIHAQSPTALIGMPSKCVDALWHEFILDTREYRRFCKSAFGGFFHHVPARTMSTEGSMGKAMRLTWRFACMEEGIDPRNANRLPLLFAIDEQLSIPGGSKFTTESFKRDNSDPGSCGGASCGGDGDGCGGGCGGGGD